jgi:small GTP-binding protein
MTYLFKIIIIGDPGVGKTSLVKKFVTNKFSKDYRITIGTNIFTKEISLKNNQIIKMQLWDIAGQERWEKTRHLYYKGAHGVMMVADFTRKKTFEHLYSFWEKDLAKYCKDAPIILIANKNDLENIVSIGEIDTTRKAINAINIFKTSAKNGSNVNECFRNLTEEILKKK